MKSLALSILAFAFVSPAVAMPIGDLDRNKVTIGYASVELVGQEELCPKDVTCVANGTVVELLLSYNCGTQPGRVVANTLKVGDDLHVFVAAPLLAYPNRIAMCIAPSFQTQKLTLINQYGKVVLHELNSQTAR